MDDFDRKHRGGGYSGLIATRCSTCSGNEGPSSANALCGRMDKAPTCLFGQMSRDYGVPVPERQPTAASTGILPLFTLTHSLNARLYRYSYEFNQTRSRNPPQSTRAIICHGHTSGRAQGGDCRPPCGRRVSHNTDMLCACCYCHGESIRDRILVAKLSERTSALATTQKPARNKH